MSFAVVQVQIDNGVSCFHTNNKIGLQYNSQHFNLKVNVEFNLMIMFNRWKLSTKSEHHGNRIRQVFLRIQDLI